MTESMNGQSREGLSREGMEMHIANAILLWRNKKGTKNDCRLVVSHVLRTYHKFLKKERRDLKIPCTPQSRQVYEPSGKRKIVLEHAIPILCLTNVLFQEVNGPSPDDAVRQVSKVIKEEMHLAWVTQHEHEKLNERFACSMPDDHDHYPGWGGTHGPGMTNPGLTARLRRNNTVAGRTAPNYPGFTGVNVASPNRESSNQLSETLKEWNDYLERWRNRPG
jgi:hypothetical protein